MVNLLDIFPLTFDEFLAAVAPPHLSKNTLPTTNLNTHCASQNAVIERMGI